MLILRGSIVAAILALPSWAEEPAPVFGAKRTPHHAAPLAQDGQGDYGFARSGPSDASGALPVLIQPDEDLLAYEAEEALIEAEASDQALGAIVTD